MPTDASGPSSLLVNLAPILLIFGVFYLLVLRPQSKKQKEHERMLNELKQGDRVVTSGGLCGVVRAIKGSRAEIEIAKGVRVEVVRSYIAGVTKAEAPDGPQGGGPVS